MKRPWYQQLGPLLERYFIRPGLPPNEHRRAVLLGGYLLVLIPVVVGLTIKALVSGQTQKIIATLTILPILLLQSAWLRFGRRPLIMFRILVLMSMAIVGWAAWRGGQENLAFLWFYLLPPLLFFLIGRKEGTWWLSASYLLAAGFFLDLIPSDHDGALGISFLISYLILSLLSYGLESAREQHLERLLAEKEALAEALAQGQILQNLLPMCASCKRVRDDAGYWGQIESYLQKYPEVELRHSLCTTCETVKRAKISPVTDIRDARRHADRVEMPRGRQIGRLDEWVSEENGLSALPHERNLGGLEAKLRDRRWRLYSAIGLATVMPSVAFYGITAGHPEHAGESFLVLALSAFLMAVLATSSRVDTSRWFPRLGNAAALTVLAYSMATGGFDGFAFIWLYFLPLLGFYVFGRREGTCWALATLALGLVFLAGPLAFDDKPEWALVFSITYSLVTVVSFALETSRVTSRRRLKAETEALQRALAKVRALRGLLPICPTCKRVRDGEGFWGQIEDYLATHVDTRFSHGLCPECASDFLAELENTG